MHSTTEPPFGHRNQVDDETVAGANRVYGISIMRKTILHLTRHTTYVVVM